MVCLQFSHTNNAFSRTRIYYLVFREMLWKRKRTREVSLDYLRLLYLQSVGFFDF